MSFISRALGVFFAALMTVCLAAQTVPAAADFQNPFYLAAVADASVRTQAEVSKNLTAIAAWEPDLAWEAEPGNSRVLMTTVTREYYDNSVGQEYTLSFGQLWVTASGELKDFFGDPTNQWSNLRMEQLMGMPPGIEYTRVVEMYVEPGDMFRPTPDPEVNDTTCTLDFPVGSGVSVSQEHIEWFSNRIDNIYSGQEPWPWTGLGYTYDWGSQDHEGLSEFVVQKDSVVKIEAVYTMDEYFDPDAGNPFLN